MPVPRWITFRESTHGVNNDGFADVSNRPSRTLWSNFCAEHNKDATHKAGLSANTYLMEQGHYTGDGTGTVTVSFTESHLRAKFVRVFGLDGTSTFWVDDQMQEETGEDYAIDTWGVSQSNVIEDARTTGELTFGTAMNTNTVEYFWSAWGVVL
jgi:hypothetical protein